jgi:hypothetical protein
MSQRLVLVDYENVQALDVATIPGDVRVHVVLGAKQKSVVAKVEAKLKPLGDRATVNRIKTLAPNAVDFCIAYYLGEELTQRPEPPRLSRRLHSLRGWSNGNTDEVFSRSPGAGSALGARAPT